MTAKKERQKLARKIWRACKKVLSYPESHSLARALHSYGQGYGAREWAKKRGYESRAVTYCECCGPAEVRINVRGNVIVVPYYLGRGEDEPAYISQEAD